MNDTTDKALLPAGMQDGLPPEAAMEAKAVSAMMATFASMGYQRVKPPLLEFEESLLGGIGQALNAEAFRLQDPASRRMMALRPDQTPQVARIASSRMGKSPRPLRLAYSGEIVRVRGSQIRSERQFGQVGAELIGIDSCNGDVEIVLMALEALETAGVADITIDLGIPAIASSIISKSGVDDETASAVRGSLDHKDAAETIKLEGKIGADTAKSLAGLLGAVGPAPQAIKKLKSLKLGKDNMALIDNLSQVMDGIMAERPDASLTIDPVENRGFEYHTGVTFAFFSKQSRGELGRGGRYQVSDSAKEQATGLTLFMDTILRSLPSEKEKETVLIPLGTDANDGRKLRSEGWVTIKQLDKNKDAKAEAKHLGCSHVLIDGKATKI